MRLSPLAGLRFGDEALFATGRARPFGSDGTPDSSLVGRWKEIPLLSLSGGRWAIGQAQHRGLQTPRFACRVEALDVPVLVRGAIAVPGRCTCVDSAHSAY